MKFYAEIASWGADQTTVVSFDSRKDRDNFVSTTDYTSRVYASDPRARGCMSYSKYESLRRADFDAIHAHNKEILEGIV